MQICGHEVMYIVSSFFINYLKSVLSEAGESKGLMICFCEIFFHHYYYYDYLWRGIVIVLSVLFIQGML